MSCYYIKRLFIGNNLKWKKGFTIDIIDEKWHDDFSLPVVRSFVTLYSVRLNNEMVLWLHCNDGDDCLCNKCNLEYCSWDIS